MALNLMEPLVKTAIGRQELPFPAFFELLKPFRTRYALLHCQAIFQAESLACVQIILQIMTLCQQKMRDIVRNNKKQVQ